MRAAVLASACALIGGIALGLVAADRELLAELSGLEVFISDTGPSEAQAYPLANRDGKYDRMVVLRTDREDIEPQPALRRGDSLRQSYSAADTVAPIPQADAAPPPLPKPRPKAMLLRRQQASYTLLSDLQIDAIKTRLKLSAEQERNWPAVEEALRGLAVRLHAMKKAGEAPTDMPAESNEFTKLKAATAPFIAGLTADQKRELRMLGHIIGLGRVMAQL